MGGAEIQLLSLVQGLDKERYKPTVGVFYRGKELDENFERIKGLRVAYLDKKGSLDFFFLWNLALLLKRERFEIIQPYNVSARLIGLVAAKIARIPFTVMTERTARALYSTPGSRIYQFFERYAMRCATVVVANSMAGRHFAVARGMPRHKTYVIYNGIDPFRLAATKDFHPRERFHIGKNELVVGMIARLEWQKDPLTFIRAAKIVTGDYPDVRFFVVGDGPLNDELRVLSRNTGMAGKIVFAGSHVAVGDYLNIMDVFVLCSRRIEGCSNAVLEALTMGVPVVATDVGGNREIIEEGVTGFLVEPENPIQLAAKITRLLRDKKLHKRMSAEARSCAQRRFSQKTMVTAYEQLYEQALSRQQAWVSCKSSRV